MQKTFLLELTKSGIYEILPVCLTNTYHLFQIFLTQSWTKTLLLDLYLSPNLLYLQDKIYNNLLMKANRSSNLLQRCG